MAMSSLHNIHVMLHTTIKKCKKRQVEILRNRPKTHITDEFNVENLKISYISGHKRQKYRVDNVLAIKNTKERWETTRKCPILKYNIP